MTSGGTIFQHLKSDPCFKGLEIRLFFIDEKPDFESSNVPFVYIFNTKSKKEVSSNKLGHWICLYYNGNIEKNIVFFNSLGGPPPKMLLKNISKCGIFKSYTHVNHPIQSELSQLCGHYIIVFSYLLFCVGLNFSQFLELFSENRIENDKRIFDIYNRIYRVF